MTTNNEIIRPITKELVEAYGLGEYCKHFENKCATVLHVVYIPFIGVLYMSTPSSSTAIQCNNYKEAVALRNKINDMLSEARNAPVKATETDWFFRTRFMCHS